MTKNNEGLAKFPSHYLGKSSTFPMRVLYFLISIGSSLQNQIASNTTWPNLEQVPCRGGSGTLSPLADRWFFQSPATNQDIVSTVYSKWPYRGGALFWRILSSVL